MKKEMIDLVQDAMRRSFLAGLSAPVEPEPWQRETMSAVMAAAAAGDDHAGAYWFSPRQEKILWRTAWASLAVVLIVAVGYFGFAGDTRDTDLVSIAVVDMEGLQY